MTVADIRKVQADINAYLFAHSLPVDRLDVDGEYGPMSKKAVRTVKLCLGYKPKYATSELTTAFKNRVAHWRTARLFRPGMVARGIAYRRWLRHSNPLRIRAWNIAGGLVGIRESGGNNRGPWVERIIRAMGGQPGEPWCGDTVGYCYQRAGSRAVVRAWAAVRYMLTRSVRKTSDPQIGDIVRFTFDHTGLFGWWSDSSGSRTTKARATHIRTREGNTGATGAVSDSRSGGDGVYEKVRHRSLVADFLRVER